MYFHPQCKIAQVPEGSGRTVLGRIWKEGYVWMDNTVQVEEETERQRMETGGEWKIQTAWIIIDRKPGLNTRNRDLGSRCCLEQVCSKEKRRSTARWLLRSGRTGGEHAWKRTETHHKYLSSSFLRQPNKTLNFGQQHKARGGNVSCKTASTSGLFNSSCWVQD